MNIKAQRRHAIEAAQALIAKARAESRDLTSSERSELQAKHDEVMDLTRRIEAAEKGDDLVAQMDKLAVGSGLLGKDGRDTGTLSFKGVAEKVLHTAEGSPRRIKSLIAAGSQTVETVGQPLVAQWERPVGDLLQVLPSKQVPENFSYLRQTVRTNNAAPVAVGALKPTSVFTLARVESKLRVIAHLSEPIPEYWLKDEGALKQFVESEMIGGLRDAVIQQALVGDGTGENLLGIRLQSGIQTQAFTTDMFESIRRGIGAAEDLGYTPAAIVMAPSDWTHRAHEEGRRRRLPPRGLQRWGSDRPGQEAGLGRARGHQHGAPDRLRDPPLAGHRRDLP